VDVGRRVRRLAHEGERLATAVETESTQHRRSALDLLDTIRSDVNDVNLCAGAFGFAEVDALTIGGPSGNARLSVERSSEHLRLASARREDLNHAALRPARWVIAHADRDRLPIRRVKRCVFSGGCVREYCHL